MRKSLIMGALLAGTFATVPASAQVVFSDGFEGDALGAPQPSLVNWDVVRGSVDIVGSGDSFNLPCAGGARCLDLDGTTNAGGEIVTRDSFSFAAGNLVTLTFDLAGSQRGDAPNPFSAGFRFGGLTDVLQFTPGGGFGTVDPTNGLGLSQLFYNGTVSSDSPYTSYTLSFRVGQAGSLQTFFNTGSADNIGPLLDNVSLSIAAVPEPATWAMMIGGIGAVGGTLRRRKAKVSVRFA